MEIGMLWFDDNPLVNINDKVIKAASYYALKYGRKPNICFVNPMILKTGISDNVNGIEIKASRTILKNHFWLGIRQSSVIN
jgi:hypothetical protein